MIESIFITAFVIILIHVSMWEGMIFSFIPWIIEYTICDWKLSPYIQKPLYECMTCMCSIWGTFLWYFYFMEYDWLLFVGGVGGVLAIFDILINFIIMKRENFNDDGL